MSCLYMRLVQIRWWSGVLCTALVQQWRIESCILHAIEIFPGNERLPVVSAIQCLPMATTSRACRDAYSQYVVLVGQEVRRRLSVQFQARKVGSVIHRQIGCVVCARVIFKRSGWHTYGKRCVRAAARSSKVVDRCDPTICRCLCAALCASGGARCHKQ